MTEREFDLSKKFEAPVTIGFSSSREVSYDIEGVIEIIQISDGSLVLVKADGSYAHIKDYIFVDVQMPRLGG